MRPLLYATSGLLLALSSFSASHANPLATTTQSIEKNKDRIILACDPPACPRGYVAVYTGRSGSCGYRCMKSDYNPNDS